MAKSVSLQFRYRVAVTRPCTESFIVCTGVEGGGVKISICIRDFDVASTAVSCRDRRNTHTRLTALFPGLHR